MDRQSITEAELVTNANNGAVSFIQVVKTEVPGREALGFNLYVRLTWMEGELLLVTYKKKPRYWLSLDRLLKHIEKHYSKILNLKIHLEGTNDAAKRTPPSSG